MKTKISIFSLFLSLFILTSAHATGGFFCIEYDTTTGEEISDGYYIYGTYTWSFGNALVDKVKLRDPGHTDIELEMSQYKNSDNELYYLSVMDLNNADPTAPLVQRTVELDAKSDEMGRMRGTLTQSYTNDPGEKVPVDCTFDI